jgi:dynein heavy chain
VLLDAKVSAVKESIFSISNEASQEASLEELLSKVVSRWAGIELAVVPYNDSKDVHILGSLDNIQVCLLRVGVLGLTPCGLTAEVTGQPDSCF